MTELIYSIPGNFELVVILLAFPVIFFLILLISQVCLHSKMRELQRKIDDLTHQLASK